jgi:hypothetical protein
MTHYLRFPDEPTGMAALEAAGFTTVDDSGATIVITATHTWALDVIGTISRGGVWDQQTGAELVPPTILPGWHANYAADTLPPELEQYLVQPRNPVRVFAGTDATVT